MTELKVGDKIIALDEEGYLKDFEQWDPDVAHVLAPREGIDELTDDHFIVLNTIRDYYKKFKVAPILNLLCRECGKSYREVHKLFLGKPGKRAAKIAGLPKPSGCV